MSRRVYFAFHYKDVIDFRANVVRNSWLTRGEDAGYFDASIWENAKTTSAYAVRNLIDRELFNTSVTCVLIGTHTYERRWVNYEIMKSVAKGNHIFGVHINSIKDRYGYAKEPGHNPFNYLGYSIQNSGTRLVLHNYVNNQWVTYTDLDGWAVRQSDTHAIIQLSNWCPVYDWVTDNGYFNFSDWVNKANT